MDNVFDKMQRDVLDHGFVRLVDHMPREDLDTSIVQAARVSYGDGTKTSRGDRGLIRYLLRHWHTTPFEMVEFKFHIKMPIFLARQHMRHRTASINEISGRYSQLPEEFHVPTEFRGQSKVNHQGSEGVLESSESMVLLRDQKASCEQAFDVYQRLLDHGIARETAREHLPLSTYTEFYWKINLHNLLHYLRLRMDRHAQPEIQLYANAMYDLVKPLIPAVAESYEDYILGSITLSKVDLAKIKQNLLDGKHEPYPSPSEEQEFSAKLHALGIV